MRATKSAWASPASNCPSSPSAKWPEPDMALGRKRSVEVFSLSFLDCICCGFGAVILFYTIISAQSGIDRNRSTENMRSQVEQLEEKVLEGTRNLVILRNTLEKTKTETASAESKATQ